VREPLREQGHVREGPARAAVVQVRRVVHRSALRGQVRLRVHRRRHRGHRHIPDRHCAVRVDDMRPVGARQGAQEADGPDQRSDGLAGELLLRRGAVRRVHSAVASFHVRALLRRRGGRLGDAKLLQRDLHERGSTQRENEQFGQVECQHLRKQRRLIRQTQEARLQRQER